MPTTKYLWDEANDSYLAETDESDALIAAYTVEPAHFGRVVSEARDDETSYHHYDALGSTRQLTDESGEVTDVLDCDAWGQIIIHVGSSPSSFIWKGEVGYQVDRFCARLYVRARHYDPSISRWISRDPLIDRQAALHLLSSLQLTHPAVLRRLIRNTSVSPSSYCGNQPILKSDPSGLEEVSGRTIHKDCRTAFCVDACKAAVLDKVIPDVGGGGVICWDGALCPRVFHYTYKVDGKSATISPGECPEYDLCVLDHEMIHVLNDFEDGNPCKPNERTRPKTTEVVDRHCLMHEWSAQCQISALVNAPNVTERCKEKMRMSSRALIDSMERIGCRRRLGQRAQGYLTNRRLLEEEIKRPNADCANVNRFAVPSEPKEMPGGPC